MEPPKRGSQELNQEHIGLKILHDHAAPSVNIIAVHGLAADPVETWVHERSKWNWLDNELVQLIPRARVWTFGYHSAWFGDFSVDAIIDEAAGMLLDAIKFHNLLPTPLMFVAHSFGGIVVMKSLMMAENPGNQWSTNCQALNLFSFTELILFFGTPFRGLHDWIQTDLPAHAIKLSPSVRDDTFNSFRKESPFLNELSEKFVEMSHRYGKPNLGCFWEQSLSEVGELVNDKTIQPILLVDENSAVLQGYSWKGPWCKGEVLSGNHFNIHQFDSGGVEFAWTVKHVLDRIKFSVRAFCLDDLGRSFNPDEEECAKSLGFPDMDRQKHDVVNAADGTCNWLFETAEYLRWLNQRHGLFWIKGHAGAGKSTIMKHISRHAMKDDSVIVASFFFQAGGVAMQHTITGILRSLLHQFMSQVPDLCSKITQTYWIKRERNFDWEWSQNELQEAFLTCVAEAAKTYRMQIYIDALDECGEEAAVHLVEVFRSVADSLCICLSRRHHLLSGHDPLIAFKDELEVSVEENNATDIKRYLRHQLDESLFQDQISKKALGNFLWVTLVVGQVRSWLGRGVSSDIITNKIRSLPIGLSELHELWFINIDKSDLEESLKLFQWICFALRPLSLQELRLAMVLDEDTSYLSIQECQESESYIGSNETIIKRVHDLSQGLAEIPVYTRFLKGKKDMWYGNVRVIHRSVHDFLLEKGLRILYEGQNRGRDKTLIGWSHFRLSRSCIHLLSMSEVHKLSLKVDDDCLFDVDVPQDTRIRKAHHKYPLLVYATEFWCQHVEMVEKEIIAQDDLLSYFAFNSRSPTSLFISWTTIFEDLFETWKTPYYTVSGPTINFYACKHGLLSVLNAALDQGKGINFIDSPNGAPLLWAVRGGQEAVVKWLLEKDHLKNLFDEGVIQEAVLVAAEDGHEAILRLLLQQHDTTAAASGNSIGSWPLLKAAKNGHEPIIRLLLARDNAAAAANDESAQSRIATNQKALAQAAFFGHTTVVKLLLDQDGVSADLPNSRGHTPLTQAAMGGHEAVVRLLLARDDVSANRRTRGTGEGDGNRDGFTPLYYASMAGSEEVVKLLLARDEVRADRDGIEFASGSIMFDGGRVSGDVIRGLLEEYLASFPENGE